MAHQLDSDFISDWETAARCSGDREALSHGQRSLTYSELDALTDVIADRLCDRGLGAECLVGLDFRQPADYVIGAVATLKAGAAFLIPTPRTGRRSRGREPLSVPVDLWLVRVGEDSFGSADSERIALDTCFEGIGATGSSWQDRLRAPTQLAYVMYSSGSTGAPKCAMIERASLGALCAAVRERLGLEASDRWFQLASPAFDVFIEESFPILTSGGSVICRPSLELLGFPGLHEALHRSGATIVEMTTQYWYEYQRWLVAKDRIPPPGLRAIVVGGERMGAKEYHCWQTRFDTALIHVYGTTEATVSSTMFGGRLFPEDTDVPIGRALSNSRVCIGGTPPGRSEHGPIYLGGKCVGRGYLGEPAFTATRFVPDPEGPSGSRLYATGDLGFVNAAGELVYRGRDDDQVKVRGHRIQYSDVEFAMQSVPGIAQAVVIRDPQIGSNLLAFVVLAAPSEPLQSAAQQWVGQQLVGQQWVGRQLLGRQLLGRARAAICDRLPDWLPEWAVPGRIFTIRELPKTVNGKIDRSKLSRLAQASEKPEASCPGPQADLAQAVLSSFRSVLRAPELGLDSNFFDYGGDSLLALSIVSRIGEASGTDLSAALIFDAPTPREFARRVSIKLAAATGHASDSSG